MRRATAADVDRLLALQDDCRMRIQVTVFLTPKLLGWERGWASIPTDPGRAGQPSRGLDPVLTVAKALMP